MTPTRFRTPASHQRTESTHLTIQPRILDDAAPPPTPIVFLCTEIFCDGIAANVVPRFARFFFVAQAVVEISLLPPHPLKARRAALPISDGFRHRPLARKGQHRVRMIGHEQEQSAPPVPQRVIISHRPEQFDRECGLSQWRLAHIGTNPKMKERTVPDPSRSVVMQTPRIFAHKFQDRDFEVERVDPNALLKPATLPSRVLRSSRSTLQTPPHKTLSRRRRFPEARPFT